MRVAVLLLAALILAGCVTQAPSPAPVSSERTTITAEAATAVAVGQVVSTTPVKVVSRMLSTYGAEPGGASIVAASTPVWAVRLSGSFTPPSCGPFTATPHPCPSPPTSALVLIDARTGAFIQAEMPAPSPLRDSQPSLSPAPAPSATPWWPHTGITTCGSVAFYRIGAQVVHLGNCAGLLLDPPETATLHIGQTLDLAVIPGFGASGSLSSSSVVLRLVVTSNDGQTVTYRAEATGEALLTTTGALCLNWRTDQETSGTCPLLAVSVVR